MTHLQHYLNYATANESPALYHLWCGLSMLSSATGRRIWTDMEKFKVYPNMYVFLVGEAGIAKTTAMNGAKDAIRAAFPNMFLAPASITKEAIVQTMAPEKDKPSQCEVRFMHDNKTYAFSQMAVFANELVVMLNAGGNLPGMIDFLTDMFDTDEFRDKTKWKGDHTVKNPFFGVLGCITTEMMKRMVQDKFITGGLARRCLFVSAHKNERPVPFIEYSESQRFSQEECIRLLKIVPKYTGPFIWDTDAREFYTQWYIENFNRIETTPSEALRTFLRTKPVYAHKVSMLLALSEHPEKLVHTLKNYRQATEWLSCIESGAPALFDSTGVNRLAPLADKVAVYLRSVSLPITVQQLQVKFWSDLKDADPTDMDKVCEQLFRMGKIQWTLNEETKTKNIQWKKD